MAQIEYRDGMVPNPNDPPKLPRDEYRLLPTNNSRVHCRTPV